jgi:hypothetical protein
MLAVQKNAVESSSTEPRGHGSTLYGLFVLSIGVCLGGNLLVRIGARGGWLPFAGQAVIAALSVLPLALSAVMFWRLLRRELDEMLQKIVLEGLAFALVLYLPLAGLYVNLRTAGVWTPNLDPPDILMTPAVLVALGIALASRRYR